MPGQFSYYIYKDEGFSGRLECTVFKHQKGDHGEGELIHSKASSGKYIHDDYATFHTMLEHALE